MITKTGVSYMIASAVIMCAMYWVWVDAIAPTINELSNVLGK